MMHGSQIFKPLENVLSVTTNLTGYLGTCRGMKIFVNFEVFGLART